MAKQPQKKKPSSQTVAKKAAPKAKAGKKPTSKKMVAKKPANKKTVTKASTAKKASAKKAPVTKKVATGKATKTGPRKVAVKKKKSVSVEPIKKAIRKAVTTGTSSAAVKKSISVTTTKKKGRVKPGKRTAFTLEEVQEIAKKNALEDEQTPSSTEAAKAEAARKAAKLAEVEQESRVHAAASLAEILGYNPASSNPRENEEKKIPRKHIRYYRLLIGLSDHVKSEISLHTEDTLKRSSKDESGDLSSYSQHTADAGTDTFDRDFALSLVSSEQEALFEIEEAIARIKSGAYGVCELTGKPIAKERLLAVPFARYSVESQSQMEKTRKRSIHRGGIFADANDQDAAAFVRDDSDD